VNRCTSATKELLEQLLVGEGDKSLEFWVFTLAELLGQGDEAIKICLMHLLVLRWLENKLNDLCQQDLAILDVAVIEIRSLRASSNQSQNSLDPVKQGVVLVLMGNLQTTQQSFDKFVCIHSFLNMLRSAHFLYVNSDKV
jgi:hypothetical protein